MQVEYYLQKNAIDKLSLYSYWNCLYSLWTNTDRERYESISLIPSKSKADRALCPS